MASSLSAMESLPLDAFDRLMEFLTAPSLLALSHASRALFTELLAPDSAVWTQRQLSSTVSPFVNAKHRHTMNFTTRAYEFLDPTHDQQDLRVSTGAAVNSIPSLVVRTAYQFPARDAQAHALRKRGGALVLDDKIDNTFFSSSFSISVRFALQPSPGQSRMKAYTGGVLFGGQSSSVKDPVAPQFSHPCIHVDRQGDLYCSITDRKILVARKLKRGRWYHVVLTYDRGHWDRGRGTQCVYLDGELVSLSSGDYHRERYLLSYWQFGSGFFSDEGMATVDYGVWNGFRGVIDEASVWQAVLLPEEIQKMTTQVVKKKTEYPGESRVKWSLQEWLYPTHPSTVPDVFGAVKRVRCSLPSDRYAEGVHGGYTFILQ